MVIRAHISKNNFVAIYESSDNPDQGGQFSCRKGLGSLVFDVTHRANSIGAASFAVGARVYADGAEGAGRDGDGLAAIVAAMTVEPWWSPSEVCKVCTDPSEGWSMSFLCSRCRRIYEQGGPGLKKKEARFQAMRAQWNDEAKAFLCHFTDLPLTEAPGTRTSATWEHLTPGDPLSVVLAADLVNKMKGNMTEAQFRGMVVALADHFGTNEPLDRKAFPVEASPLDATNDSEPDTPPATQ